MGKGDGGEDGVKAKARKGRDKTRRTYELNGKNSAKHVRLRVAQTSNVQACSWQCAAFMHRHINRPCFLAQAPPVTRSISGSLISKPGR